MTQQTFMDEAPAAVKPLPDGVGDKGVSIYGMKIHEYLSILEIDAWDTPMDEKEHAEIDPILKAIIHDSENMIRGYFKRAMRAKRLLFSRKMPMKLLAIPTKTEREIDLQKCQKQFGTGVVEEYLKPYIQRLGQMEKAARWLAEHRPHTAVPDWVEHTIHGVKCRG